MPKVKGKEVTLALLPWPTWESAKRPFHFNQESVRSDNCPPSPHVSSPSCLQPHHPKTTGQSARVATCVSTLILSSVSQPKHGGRCFPPRNQSCPWGQFRLSVGQERVCRPITAKSVTCDLCFLTTFSQTQIQHPLQLCKTVIKNKRQVFRFLFLGIMRYFSQSVEIKLLTPRIESPIPGVVLTQSRIEMMVLHQQPVFRALLWPNTEHTRIMVVLRSRCTKPPSPSQCCHNLQRTEHSGG